ncbi:MAG: NAD(P)H-dependent glycerol-3-phosphate dehydrogenase [Clostridiales bacterium]|nr:NAD(P)H-dependent glycerol-3-phosphate dehydrogenase [Clostridiales bacterium]
MKKIAVIGAGSWGVALARVLSKKNDRVYLWSFFEDEAQMLQKGREHKSKLPNIILPENIFCTSDIKLVLEDADMALLVVPSDVVRNTAKLMKPYITKNTIIVNCSKGIEQGTDLLMTQVIEQEISNCKIGVLTGPTHAEEVARDIPTAIVAASNDIKTAEFIQDAFMSECFRVYTNTDVIGVQLGGALKNIIALCAGITDGLNLGDNTKAALMTRGMAEIVRLGVALGAKKETFSGLTGIGDLIVTCTSMHSRNRRAGILIGQGKTPSEAMDEVKMVVEGIKTAKGAYELSQKLNVSMPITKKAYDILFNGVDPRSAVYELMNRDKKSEV